MGRLEAIWLKTARGGPMAERREATLVAGEGIVGDANSGGRRQVTVISRESWQEAAAELGVGVGPAARRANFLLSGVELPQSEGRLLRIGRATLRILGETRPCSRIEREAAGLERALAGGWRGGAWGEVVEGGPVAVGDPVDWAVGESAAT